MRVATGSDELLVLGTDGLFEFCSTKEVATRLCASVLSHFEGVSKAFRGTEGVSDDVLEDVCSVARRRWARSSYNDTVDDITAIAAGCQAPFEGIFEGKRGFLKLFEAVSARWRPVGGREGHVHVARPSIFHYFSIYMI